MTKNRLAIVGSGDLGQLIAYHAIQSNQYQLAGFYDDYKTKEEKAGLGKILGGSANILSDYQNDCFDCLAIGIGYKHIAFREQVFNDFFNKIPLANIIHPSAYVDSSCVLGQGIVILPGCTLDKGVELGHNVLLNTGCVIAHDSKVDNHSFLAPAVKVAGFVHIGNSCFIGINTTIIDNIKIASYTQTGGGAVITKNIEQAGLYVGVPAKRIK